MLFMLAPLIIRLEAEVPPPPPPPRPQIEERVVLKEYRIDPAVLAKMCDEPCRIEYTVDRRTNILTVTVLAE
jgi:hypothetical protein